MEMDDTNKVVENTTMHGSGPPSLESEPLPEVKYDGYDGYLTSNDDGDDDGDEDSKDGDAYCDYLDILVAEAIRDDDVPEFVALMESLFVLDDDDDYLEPGEIAEPNTRKPMMCPDYILKQICVNGALACATALLQGQTFVFVDLNTQLPDGDYPLHFVASVLNYDLVKLFLSHGARTDIFNDFLKIKIALPLNLALEQLNNHLYLVHWSPEDSIYKLPIILCLPQMKVALETIGLLALLTKDVKEVFIDYAKKGQLIEMAVLLLVANERIMAPRTFQSKDIVGCTTIWNTIDPKSKVPCYNGVKTGELAQMRRRRSASFTLTLLKLFEGAGDAIRSYLQSRPSHLPKEKVVNDVASILKEAGFVLKEADIDLSNIDSESYDIKEATGVVENTITYDSSKYYDMVETSIEFMLGKGVQATIKEFMEEDLKSMDKDVGLSNIDCESNEIKEATPASGGYTRVGCCMVSPKFIERKVKLTQCGRPSVRMIPPPRCFTSANHFVRKFSSFEFFMRQKTQFKGETNAMWRPIQPSISSNILASLAMSFKRGLRRV